MSEWTDQHGKPVTFDQMLDQIAESRHLHYPFGSKQFLRGNAANAHCRSW